MGRLSITFGVQQRVSPGDGRGALQMDSDSSPEEGHPRLFSGADERRLSDPTTQEMRYPRSRDLLLLVALFLALLSGGLAAHTAMYSHPVVTRAEVSLYAVSVTLTAVGLAAATKLWLDRPTSIADSPAGNRTDS